MFKMRFTGTNEEILAYIKDLRPEMEAKLAKARGLVQVTKREIYYHEAAVLYAAAFALTGEILEIGTMYGYSAAVLALAAPEAHIVTMAPRDPHVNIARANLKSLPNVEVVQAYSWDYLEKYNGPALDMLFIDGDHNQIERDLLWWDWLEVKGLMLNHDYCPPEADIRPCRPCFEALNKFEKAHHRAEILVVNDHKQGMHGIYKRVSEVPAINLVAVRAEPLPVEV